MGRRNEVLLGGLMVVFAVILVYQLSGWSGGGGMGGRGGGAATRLELGALGIFPVDWGALVAARPEYDPTGRNIFQFGAPRRPTPPKLTPEETKAIADARKKAQEERQKLLVEARKPPPPVQGPPPPPVKVKPPPPPKPRPPKVTYKFIGYIGPPEGKMAILHDGKDVIFARQGDELGDAFRILEIGYESIKFGFTDRQFEGETEIIPMSSAG
jgi:hypothetical protein